MTTIVQKLVKIEKTNPTSHMKLKTFTLNSELSCNFLGYIISDHSFLYYVPKRASLKNKNSEFHKRQCNCTFYIKLGSDATIYNIGRYKFCYLSIALNLYYPPPLENVIRSQIVWLAEKKQYVELYFELNFL